MGSYDQLRIQCQSNTQSIDQPINRSIDQSINPWTDRSINQSINPWTDRSINRSINQSINQSLNCNDETYRHSRHGNLWNRLPRGSRCSGRHFSVKPCPSRITCRNPLRSRKRLYRRFVETRWNSSCYRGPSAGWRLLPSSTVITSQSEKSPDPRSARKLRAEPDELITPVARRTRTTRKRQTREKKTGGCKNPPDALRKYLLVLSLHTIVSWLQRRLLGRQFRGCWWAG